MRLWKCWKNPTGVRGRVRKAGSAWSTRSDPASSFPIPFSCQWDRLVSQDFVSTLLLRICSTALGKKFKVKKVWKPVACFRGHMLSRTFTPQGGEYSSKYMEFKFELSGCSVSQHMSRQNKWKYSPSGSGKLSLPITNSTSNLCRTWVNSNSFEVGWTLTILSFKVHYV